MAFVTRATISSLGPCWTTNLGPGGAGLTAALAGGRAPGPGDELELELDADGGGLRVRCRVAWTGPRRDDDRLWLGVQFCELSATAQLTLAQLLAARRHRVVVARSPLATRTAITRALARAQVEHVDSLDELAAALRRPCAAIVTFADDPSELHALVETAAASHVAEQLGDIPAPSITVCGEPDRELLLGLIAEGKVHQALPPPFEPIALGLAIERSCESWALQLELRWTSVQLEGLAAAPAREPRPVPRPVAGRTTAVRVSAAMRRVYELIARVAIHDVPVLLIGETGTGKELAAHELHAQSRRSHTPFVTQDCGALTETLLESELFGHVRGAFTGATSDHPGLFQLAEGGTIFLDEIQNTSPALQAKLLRVVEHGDYRPIGSARPRRADVRLIAACNVDLREAVKERRFRADFFYRLNRFPIELPPLRQHRDDILPLTRYFLERTCAATGQPEPYVEAAVERALLDYPWPGNIRELRNVVERAVLLTARGETIGLDVLPAEVTERGLGLELTNGLDAQLARFERSLIQETLERNDGVIRRAARELSVNAVTLSRRMRRLGL